MSDVIRVDPGEFLKRSANEQFFVHNRTEVARTAIVDVSGASANEAWQEMNAPGKGKIRVKEVSFDMLEALAGSRHASGMRFFRREGDGPLQELLFGGRADGSGAKDRALDTKIAEVKEGLRTRTGRRRRER